MANYDGSFNTRLTGTLANSATDIYKLTATSGGKLQFSFVHPNGPGTSGDTFRLILLDAAGNEVFRQEVAGNFTLDTTIAAAGEYYLSVIDADWSTAPPGTYSMTATLSNSAGAIYDGAANNSSATAIDAPLGAPIFGSIAGNDTDVFKVHATTGGVLTLAFAHPNGAGTTGGQVGVQVMDAASHVVASYTNLTGNATITSTIAAAGDYYLTVSDNISWDRNGGLYTLTPTLAYVAGTIYDGPSNNSSATAIAAPMGSPIAGSLTWSDTDVFKLTATSGGVLKLNFTHPNGAGSSGPPIGIEIIDAGGNKVLDRDLKGDSALTTTVHGAGDYFVHVTGGTYLSGDEGVYRLATSFTTMPGTIYDGASNNSAAAAVHVPAGQAIVGTLASNDTDYFAIDTPVPGTLMVGFHHPAGAATTANGIILSIIDGNGEEIIEKFERGNDLFTVELPGAGTYYAKLVDPVSYDGVEPGLYSLMTGLVSNGGSTLRGTPGADHLVNTGGNDVIETGTGTDTVQYYGNANLYSITVSPAGASVTGNGGTDTLFNVERVAFGDRMVALDTEGVPAQAYRIYEAAFDRAPDLGGLGFWIRQMDAGLSLKAVAQSFIESAEFRGMYGDAPSNRDMVTKFYQNVLDRAPDEAGLGYWVDVLDRHLTDASGVLMGFSESPENVAQLVGAMSHGIAYIPYA